MKNDPYGIRAFVVEMAVCLSPLWLLVPLALVCPPVRHALEAFGGLISRLLG